MERRNSHASHTGVLGGQDGMSGVRHGRRNARLQGTRRASPIVTSAALCLAGLIVPPLPAQALLAAPAQASADPGPVPEARARATLARMTPEERLGLVQGRNPFTIRAELPKDVPLGAGYVRGIPRLGIPALVESDASLGVANMMGLLRPGDVATALPSGAALAASWDSDLAERAGAMIGAEARAKGFNVLLAGGVNLVREPRNGRNFEYLGEDPLLAGTLAGHSIRGIQSNHIISTIKHFALNSQETGRTLLSSNLREAAARESDLLAFQIGIEIGRPGSVMCAYNKFNEVYSCENAFLLNDVLRRDWAFDGFVMSDWGAVHSPSIREGLDQESGTGSNDKGYFGSQLRERLMAGTVQQSEIDQSALRILRTIYTLGVADHPLVPAPIDYDAHGVVAQRAAEEGIVLLRNDRNLLPIAPSTRRILIVGDHADVGVLSGGGGSSQVNPVGGAALKAPAAFGKRLYAPSSPLAALRRMLPGASILFDDGTDIQRAANAAHDADLVIVFAEQFTTESLDVSNLSLPDNQDELIAAMAEANPKTVVVLQTGGPVLMPWLGKVGAVLEAWYSGQRGGIAIARVLSGAVNPSGHLATTFPASVDQLPNPTLPGSAGAGSKARSSPYVPPSVGKSFDVIFPEDSDVGYRWYERTRVRPLFAFGFGMSYTEFAYRNVHVAAGASPHISFSISNTGRRAGTDVAQVYVRINGTKRLAGWSRMWLKPGQTQRASIAVDPRILASFDVPGQSWRIAPGDYVFEVGTAADRPILTATLRLGEQHIRP